MAFREYSGSSKKRIALGEMLKSHRPSRIGNRVEPQALRRKKNKRLRRIKNMHYLYVCSPIVDGDSVVQFLRGANSHLL